MSIAGGCQCGNVRYSIEGPLQFSALCHCPSCRKSTGAPAVSWAMFERGHVHFDPARVSDYVSSEGVLRSFCATCGTSLFFEAEFLPGLIDVTTGSLDDPDRIIPQAQIWSQHETQCLKQAGAMTRFEALPPLE